MRRLLRLLPPAALAITMLLPAASSAEERLVLQSVETSSFPKVSIDLSVPGSLLAAGGLPDVRVTENGEPVEDPAIAAVARRRDPVDVVLLIDVSGSMAGRPLEDAARAATSFVEGMGPDDEMALATFDTSARTLVEFTSRRQPLLAALGTLSASGETALYDGLARASKMLGERSGRERYVVVLSDGGDTQSINTLGAALEAIDDAGARVYAVALKSPEYDPAPLQQLAEESGGRLSSTRDSAALAELFVGIAEELQNVHRITFTSAKPSTPELAYVATLRSGEEVGVLRTVVANPVFKREAELLPADWSPVASAPNPLVPPVFGVLVFLAVAAIVGSVGAVAVPHKSAIAQLDYYEQLRGTTSLERAASGKGKSRVIEAIETVVERRGLTGLLNSRLEQAGMPLRANEYMYLHVLFAALAGTFTQLVFGRFALSVIAIAVSVLLPIALVKNAITKRRRAFDEQLPDILSMIAGSLRAGWGVQQAIDLVVQEVAEPAAGEFRRVQAETRLGLSIEDSMRRMADRLDSDDFRWTVAAIAIQREVGGNLAEVLDIVAGTIRERAELRRHVSALTAESRFSGIVLVALPFFLLGAMLFLSPRYSQVLITTGAGLAILAFGLLLLAVGIVWLMRLTKVEI